MTEIEIQKEIVKAMEALGHKVFRMNSGRGRYNQHLCEPGTPDLLVVAMKGYSFWLEIKTPKGKLSPEQVAMHAELERRGQRVLVARGISDVIQ